MTIRRMDALPFLAGGGTVLCFVLGVVVNWPQPWLPVGLAGCAVALVVVFAYLDGPAVSVTADASAVLIRNTFLRYEVPRARIAGLVTVEYLSLRLELDDGRRISVRVWEPAMRATTSCRPATAASRMRPVVELLDLPPGPLRPAAPGALPGPGGPVRRRLRAGNVLLAVAPALAALALLMAAGR